MFLSFIIPPFENGIYFKRCIQSLYNQTNLDFEIIAVIPEAQEIKDYDYIDGLLNTKNNFKVLNIDDFSDNWLKNAVDLISEDAKYIQILDINTVAAPKAVEFISEIANGEDLIVPNIAIKDKSKFYRRYITSNIEKNINIERLTVLDYIYSKDLFFVYLDDIAECFYDIEILDDVFWINQVSRTYVLDICYYFSALKIKNGDADENIININCLNIIANNFGKYEISSIKINIFIKYIRKLLNIILDEDVSVEVKTEIFLNLKKLGQSIEEYPILDKIFTLNMTISYDEIKSMDVETYIALRRELIKLNSDFVSENSVNEVAKKSVSEKFNQLQEHTAVMIENINKSTREEVTAAIENLNISKTEEINDEKFEKLQEEIAALSLNLHELHSQMTERMCSISQQSSDSVLSESRNSAEEVPYLFATGQLGLKVIFRSFSGWLRYKFSRKK